jgi:hypothetical protein
MLFGNPEPRSGAAAHRGWTTLIAIGLLGMAGGPVRAVEAPREWIDLSRAVIVAPSSLSGPEKKAVALLADDVSRRSGIHWKVQDRWPAGPEPVVAVGPAAKLDAFGDHIEKRPPSREAEGYRIHVERSRPSVIVAGNDSRGVLFGVGRLLRELRTSPGSVRLAAGFQIETSPRTTLRGHQLGYRPKTNSYDGWDLAQWERYIRDLAIFGTNAVELVPPRSDDDSYSPHFPLPQLDMMIGMSRLLGEYGLDVWIWYPALDSDYTDERTVQAALKEWDENFRKLPRVDAVFVPGGDPGHTPPEVLFPFLAKVTEVLHRTHPKATMWVSPQGFNQEWLDRFLKLVNEGPAWLTGVVHGPQVRISLADLRKAVPSRYAIRGYPDITHSQQCQFPVPDWDLAFSLTEGREVINPRPRQQAIIARHYLKGSIGFISYSEGCNDDVNKFIWSGLGWDPDADVAELLRQYAQAFLGQEDLTDGFAEGLLALERHWEGPLRMNESVDQTFAHFRELDRKAKPAIRSNWRFQQAQYRAGYDAYVRHRLIRETRQEEEALHALAEAPGVSTLDALDRAERILREPVLDWDGQMLRNRVLDLGEDLFLSIRMQMSVGLYDAIAVDRGANLDTLDVPLNDRLWLRGQIQTIRSMQAEQDRLKAIDAIVRRTDPGPGGFYDDLGNLTRQPHLVREPGFAADPEFKRSALVGFGSRAGWPMAWCNNAQTLHDAPLRMHYEGLDRQARYKIRIVYAGDSFRNLIRLDADEREVHGWYRKPNPPVPVEFDVPPEATSDGSLTLSWRQEQGKGANGRGCMVAEVWLIRKEGGER